MSLFAETKISLAEEIISYQFVDRSLLHEALRLPNGVQRDNNGLAQEGDAVMRVILVKQGLRLYQSPSEYPHFT